MSEIEKVEVYNIRKNSKIIDLKNMGEVMLNFETVTKSALERIFSSQLAYYLNTMEKNGEIETTTVTTSGNRGGDKAYHYSKFDKEAQVISELFSFFPYYLNSQNIKYGGITVDPITKLVNVPFYIENNEELVQHNTEVHVIPSYKYKNYDFKNTYDKLPIFVVDDFLNGVEITKKVDICAVIVAESKGRKTNIRGIYQPEKGKPRVFNSETAKTFVKKYTLTVKRKDYINQRLEPYLEAEQRAKDVKNRINKR